MIATIPVFTNEEVDAVTEKIEALRPRWIRRGEGFSTLGVATYLDVMCSKDADANYYQRLPTYNALLADEFGEELERIKDAIEAHFEMPARFEQRVAMPGFHIFENAGVCVEDIPSQHFDLQHRYLRWPFALQSEEILSFTLALKLPQMGGGLDVWDVDESDLRRYERLGRKVNMEQLGRLKPKQTVEYRAGVMVVQLRPIMHRISPVTRRFPGDQRITLQGHAVKNNNEWVLYW